MKHDEPLQQARLKEWYRVGNRLVGLVYGHPRFEDGESVWTSTIQQEGNDWVETHNTHYTLEGPPAWSEEEPEEWDPQG